MPEDRNPRLADLRERAPEMARQPEHRPRIHGRVADVVIGLDEPDRIAVVIQVR